MKRIAIAGASGFVGRNLIYAILKSQKDIEIIAMSRGEKTSDDPRLCWRKADLFSVLDIENCLRDADVAIYLVHSMQPSAHLDQANFRDYDLILADNFGRACRSFQIKQIVYLGGIVPRQTSAKAELSIHLASRLEVEEALRSYVPGTTVFRAPIVMGKGGSSFHIILNLVKRLPVMLCPGWTSMPTSPVYVDQVSQSFIKAIGAPEHMGKTYDLSSSDQMSYLELLRKTAEFMGLKRKFFHIQSNYIGLSRLWVSTISGAPKDLVYPLLHSLKNEMVAIEERKFPGDQVKPMPIEEGLKKSIEEAKGIKYQFKNRRAARKTVRSVQRTIMPNGMNAEDVAKEYMAWLPVALRPFLNVTIENQVITFSLLSKKISLLKLKWSPERSESSRQLFYIQGGVLAAPMDRGRLEFREALNGKWMLAAIHDFYPALPWYIYIFTQAIAHLFVMKLFGRHLKLISQGKRKWIQSK